MNMIRVVRQAFCLAVVFSFILPNSIYSSEDTLRPLLWFEKNTVQYEVRKTLVERLVRANRVLKETSVILASKTPENITVDMAENIRTKMAEAQNLLLFCLQGRDVFVEAGDREFVLASLILKNHPLRNTRFYFSRSIDKLIGYIKHRDNSGPDRKTYYINKISEAREAVKKRIELMKLILIRLREEIRSETGSVGDAVRRERKAADTLGRGI